MNNDGQTLIDCIASQSLAGMILKNTTEDEKKTSGFVFLDELWHDASCLHRFYSSIYAAFLAPHFFISVFIFSTTEFLFWRTVHSQHSSNGWMVKWTKRKNDVISGNALYGHERAAKNLYLNRNSSHYVASARWHLKVIELEAHLKVMKSSANANKRQTNEPTNEWMTSPNKHEQKTRSEKISTKLST